MTATGQERSNSEKAAAAKALADRQRRYDLLHHENRIAFLKPEGHEIRALIRDSERIVADPDQYLTRSVDLTDSEYLAELDAFARERGL